MTKKTIVWDVEGVDEVVDQLERVKKAEKELADQAKKTEEATKRSAEETKRTAKLATATFVALAKLALDASSAREEAQGRVERSARQQRVTMKELGEALETVDERTRRLGLSQTDALNHMSDLIDVTGEAAKAAKLYALAQDIAATGDADLAQSVDLLTRAYKGEVEELKKLDGVSKQQAEILAGIADESERAEAATRLLTDAYSGAAEELKGTANAMDNLKEAGNDLLEVLGDVGGGLINRTAQWLGILDENDGLLDSFALGLRNFARDAKEAGTHIEAFMRFRGQEGGAFGNRSFASFVSEVDTERAEAQSAADAGVFTGETGTGYRIQRTGGRGGYGGNRGGHREVRRPRESEKPRGRGPAPLTDQEFIEQAGRDADQSRASRDSVLNSDTVKAMEEHERRIEEFEDRRVELAREGFQIRQDLEELETKLFEKKLKAREKAAEKAAKDEAAAAKAQYQAQQQGLQLAAQAVSLLDGRKKEAAFLSGLIATADAALHASHYDFFAAGKAAVAATGYFAAAGRGSSGGGGGGGGGGGASARSQPAEDPRREADLLASRPNTRSDAPFIVQFHSNFAPSPQDAEDIAAVVRRANQNGGY